MRSGREEVITYTDFLCHWVTWRSTQKKLCGRLERKRYCMMIEYPPQTSLPLIAPGWKCLLVGKLIESCSQIITQNVQHIIKQCVWSDMLPVCERLQVGLRKSPFIQVMNVVITNSQTLSFPCITYLTQLFLLPFLAMWWRPKKRAVRETTSSLPLLLFPSNTQLYVRPCMLYVVCVC